MQENLQATIKQDIPALTGLRFFAAAFVCVAHTMPYVVPGSNVTIQRLAAEGMTLFFVLSGFVIHYNYSANLLGNPAVGIYNFFVSRFARLYPLYFLCLCLDLIKNYGYSTLPKISYEAIPFYLTMTQSWFYKTLGEHSLIYQFGLMPSVAWSVSTEWFFYVIYPFVCYALMKFTNIKVRGSLLMGLCLIMPLMIYTVFMHQQAIDEFAVSQFGALAGAAHHQDSFYRWIVYFSPYSRISEFLVGCLTAAIYMQVARYRPTEREERIGLIVLICAIISVVLIHHFMFHPPTFLPGLAWIPILHECFGFAPSVAIIIFCSARYHNFISRFLCNPTILLGGEISYSMYLLHLPIAEAFSRDAAPASSLIIELADLSRLFIAMIAILGAAMITYRCIEVPARRFLRNQLMIKHAALQLAIKTN